MLSITNLYPRIAGTLAVESDIIIFLYLFGSKDRENKEKKKITNNGKNISKMLRKLATIKSIEKTILGKFKLYSDFDSLNTAVAYPVCTL